MKKKEKIGQLKSENERLKSENADLQESSRQVRTVNSWLIRSKGDVKKNLKMALGEKPDAIKIIDLSPLVGSGVSAICQDRIIFMRPGTDALKAGVKMLFGHANLWRGGECPVPEGIRFKVYLRCGSTVEIDKQPDCRYAFSFIGGITPDPMDVVGLEFLGVMPGWRLP